MSCSKTLSSKLSEKSDGLDLEFNEIMERSWKYLFPVRDLERQIDQTHALDEFISKLIQAKNAVIGTGNPDLANKLLAMECFAISMHACLKMWIELRINKAETAWLSLVDAQESAKLALRAHKSCCNARNLLDIMETYEVILFPKRMFCSQSAVFENCTCSICDAPFDNCDHISGMAYDGQMCCEIIGSIVQIEHIAIVDSPYDKGCVVHAHVDGDIETDLLTLVETKIEDEEKKGTYFKFTILRGS